jgi:hypothetical protein
VSSFENETISKASEPSIRALSKENIRYDDLIGDLRKLTATEIILRIFHAAKYPCGEH